MPDATLVIEDLHVQVEDKQILRGVDLTVEASKVHALMGPNGSGKSTLAYALAGHPRYRVPGVSVTNFLRTAMNAVRGEDVPVREFAKDLREQMRLLDMDPRFAERNLNEGFSGGEKKRHEILQMALLKPELAILDETDSGLDVDALRVVAEGVNRLRGPGLGVLLITHYTRILRYISPDVVHVMVGGRVVETGGPELADQLESEGYERWRSEPAT